MELKEKVHQQQAKVAEFLGFKVAAIRYGDLVVTDGNHEFFCEHYEQPTETLLLWVDMIKKLGDRFAFSTFNNEARIKDTKTNFDAHLRYEHLESNMFGCILSLIDFLNDEKN